MNDLQSGGASSAPWQPHPDATPGGSKVSFFSLWPFPSLFSLFMFVLFALLSLCVSLSSFALCLTLFAPRLDFRQCGTCGLDVSGASTVVQGYAYHPTCLRCAACARPIQGSFLVQGGRPHCSACAQAPVCAKCGGAIDGKYVKQGGSAYHAHCVALKGCAKCKSACLLCLRVEFVELSLLS